MAANRKITILGAGKIGESLLGGLLSSGWRKPADIVVTGRGLAEVPGDIAYDVVTIDRTRLEDMAREGIIGLRSDE